MSDRHLSDDDIQNYLDHNTEIDREAFRNHIDRCPACRNKVAAYQQLYGRLSEDVGFELKPGFAVTVASKIAAMKSSPRKKFNLEWIAYTAAAALSLAVLFYFVDVKHVFDQYLRVLASPVSAIISAVNAFAGSLTGLALQAGMDIDSSTIIYPVTILVLVIVIDRILGFRKDTLLKII
jgi:anti-sigma factor RsiW